MESGDSISLQCRFGKGEDVCTVNAEGSENGYMVSTFSLPDAVVSPHADHALYTCSAGTSDGAYAQCDGGLCFTGTEGKRSRGSARPYRQGRSFALARSPLQSRLGWDRGGWIRLLSLLRMLTPQRAAKGTDRGAGRSHRGAGAESGLCRSGRRHRSSSRSS